MPKGDIFSIIFEEIYEKTGGWSQHDRNLAVRAYQGRFYRYPEAEILPHRQTISGLVTTWTAMINEPFAGYLTNRLVVASFDLFDERKIPLPVLINEVQKRSSVAQILARAHWRESKPKYIRLREAYDRRPKKPVAPGGKQRPPQLDPRFVENIVGKSDMRDRHGAWVATIDRASARRSLATLITPIMTAVAPFPLRDTSGGSSPTQRCM